MKVLVYIEFWWRIFYMEFGLIFIPRSGLGHILLCGLGRILMEQLAGSLFIHVNGLVVLIKPLLVAERGIAPLDFAFVGGLAWVNILMIFQVGFLRKQLLTNWTFVPPELFMTCIDMSLKAVLRTELLFAIFVVTCELTWILRFLDTLILSLPDYIDAIVMLILLKFSHFWVKNQDYNVVDNKINQF